MNNDKKGTIMTVMGLFFSMGTLLCCALPALFVSVGLGAVVAGLVANVPAFVWLSENKIALFVISGIFLIVVGIIRTRPRFNLCPADPIKAVACSRLKKISTLLYWLSLVLYGIGFFFAFLLKYFF